MTFTRDDISIRNELRPGDLGFVVYMHGRLYGSEYGYGVDFETYVARSIFEFYQRHDPERDRVWYCEHAGRIVGTMFGLDRGDETAQLRYFLIDPDYRGIGLGGYLMEQFMQYLQEHRFREAYLLTAPELTAAAILYKRFGFTLAGESPSPSFGKPAIEQRYEWRRA